MSQRTHILNEVPIEWHNADVRQEFTSISSAAFDEVLKKDGQEMSWVQEPITFYNPRYQENPVVKLSWQFASEALDFVDVLIERKRFGLARQIERCCPSVGANVREGQNGQSLADFIHKNNIALKEADESEYFLSLCEAKGIPGAAALRVEAYRLVRILNKIIANSKLKQRNT